MKKYIPLIFCSLFVACSPSEKVGDVYPGWKEGQMDIHHIYTGRGEASFLILPDATTMLIDVGDHDPTYEQYPLMAEPMPDRERRAGEYVARYVERVNPNGTYVDYLMLSHYHNDHMGDATLPAAMTERRAPNYRLVGIAEAGEYLQFGMLYERGWPDYSYPKAINTADVHINNFLSFAKYHKEEFDMQQEEFEVGALDQIALKHNADKYPTFSTRNLAANAEVWSGVEGQTVRYADLHPDTRHGSINENALSIAMRFDYGAFSYYTGGDVSTSLKDEQGEWVNIESKVGEACGEVDVCKANHHSYKDAMPTDFLSAVKAKNYILNVWDQQHTQPELLDRMVNTEPKLETGYKVLSEYILPKTREEFAAEEWAKGICPEDGHIVIKAYDGGRKYKIYRLSARDEQMIITAIYGPYDAE